jgi:hypothetical protein
MREWLHKWNEVGFEARRDNEPIPLRSYVAYYLSRLLNV